MNVILAVDPGYRSGVAVLSTEGQVKYWGNLTKDELQKYLQELPMDENKFIRVVMENFIVYRQKAAKMAGDKMPAVEVIGMVKFWAGMHKIPVTLQMANILRDAEKMSRITKKGLPHKESHFIDAVNHGLFWLYKTGLAKTPLQKELQRDKD